MLLDPRFVDGYSQRSSFDVELARPSCVTGTILLSRTTKDTDSLRLFHDLQLAHRA